MGEVNGIWRDLRKQVDDPFLVSTNVIKYDGLLQEAKMPVYHN